jgi:hypothetical protein
VAYFKVLSMSVALLTRLIAGLLPRQAPVNPRPVYVGFVVKKWHWVRFCPSASPANSHSTQAKTFIFNLCGGTLGTAATTGLLYQPRMIGDGECGEIGGMTIGRGNRSTRRKPAPAPLLSTINPT